MFGWKDIAHRPVFGSLDNQQPVIKTLTEGYVDVSLFARHGDYERVQPFLSPLLQTFKPRMIHFLRGLKLLHVAPQDTGSDEEEQREGRRKTNIEIPYIPRNYHPVPHLQVGSLAVFLSNGTEINYFCVSVEMPPWSFLIQ